jgi:hypothetical protein
MSSKIVLRYGTQTSGGVDSWTSCSHRERCARKVGPVEGVGSTPDPIVAKVRCVRFG